MLWAGHFLRKNSTRREKFARRGGWLSAQGFNEYAYENCAESKLFLYLRLIRTRTNGFSARGCQMEIPCSVMSHHFGLISFIYSVLISVLMNLTLMACCGKENNENHFSFFMTYCRPFAMIQKNIMLTSALIENTTYLYTQSIR